MGVWIEIIQDFQKDIRLLVAPFVGVWIEIFFNPPLFSILLSLPSWECGLKYLDKADVDFSIVVAPFVGVWIEIKFSDVDFVIVRASLPSWECGLKLVLYLI